MEDKEILRRLQHRKPGHPIDNEIRASLVDKIRHDGIAVRQISEQYGVSTKTIFGWLREGVVDGNRNLILENNRLKKENEQLYAMLGRATAAMQRPKS
jgi:transposase